MKGNQIAGLRLTNNVLHLDVEGNELCSASISKPDQIASLKEMFIKQIENYETFWQGHQRVNETYSKEA